MIGLSTLLVVLLLAAPGTASAHVLKVDGDIGAVLHINPDDNPVTDVPTNYTISFDDDTGRFSLPKCNCSVLIIKNGAAITTKPLAVSSGEVSDDLYMFTTPGVYTMRFTGTPKTPGSFQPFTLNYEVRVTSGQANAQPMPVALWVCMSMAIGLILLAAYAQSYAGNEPSEEKR